MWSSSGIPLALRQLRSLALGRKRTSHTFTLAFQFHSAFAEQSPLIVVVVVVVVVVVADVVGVFFTLEALQKVIGKKGKQMPNIFQGAPKCVNRTPSHVTFSRICSHS